MPKNPTSMKEILNKKIQWPFPALLLDVCAGNCQRALVDNSGVIINQMEIYNKSEIVMLQGVTLCTHSTKRKDDSFSGLNFELYFKFNPSEFTLCLILKHMN
jgi:hypothetical protein